MLVLTLILTLSTVLIISLSLFKINRNNIGFFLFIVFNTASIVVLNFEHYALSFLLLSISLVILLACLLTLLKPKNKILRIVFIVFLSWCALFSSFALDLKVEGNLLSFHHPLIAPFLFLSPVLSIFLIENISRGYTLRPADRMFLYVLLIAHLSTGLFIFVPLLFGGYTKELYISILFITAILIHIFFYGTLFKGSLLQFNIEPPTTFYWKGSILLIIFVYIILFSFAARLSLEKYLMNSSLFLIALGGILFIAALLISRSFRLKINYLFLKNIYKGTYNIRNIIQDIIQIAEKEENYKMFSKQTISYLYDNFPFQSAGIEIKDNNDVFLFIIPENSKQKDFEIEKTIKNLNIRFFASHVNLEEKHTLNLISPLVFNFIFNLYSSEKRLFTEKMEIINRFRAFLIHDLKNIYQSIDLINSNIKNISPDNTFAFLTDLKQSLPYLSKRAKNTLHLLNLMKDEEEMNIITFPLEPLIKEVFSPFHREIFSISIAKHLKIKGDREKIRTAIENVIRNAYEKKQREDFKINIDASSENEWAIISIKDNGEKIKEELKEKIFQPFFSTKQKGLGIGLYQTKLLIEKNNGKIEAKNEKDGVCFTIKLPRR